MIDSLQRYLYSHPRTVDAALAAGCLAGSCPAGLVTLPGHDLAVPWWPVVLLSAISCVALMWRRTRPRTASAVALGCATATAVLGYLVTVLLLGPVLVALFSLAVRTDRRTANTFAVTGIAVLTCTTLITGPAYAPLVLNLLGPAFWLLLPTSLGTVARLRRACLEAVRVRAEHAERTRDEEARRRVAEERLRIARDLHDVVAHHLVLVKVQADAVARFLPARPEEAGRLATELTGPASSALRELKATVGLLRGPDDAGEADPAAPGLARLPELIASFRGAGLTVTVSEEGEPRPLTTGADLTAYRIVQEALTNVTKHATTRSAEVRLVHADDRLVITIANRSAGRPCSPASRGGFGLIGMRERARSVGGRLYAGPRPQGGFEVVAELPLARTAAAATEAAHPPVIT
ncbi:sensor histidine kinase [Streptomyces shenzhenensis]|uniref:histidine kinase n=1 Tax=Streptomyces shenzhenensis TaxID=943815 RepID=A0A3M0I329_9ACTN|nr:sensor histidine kinase [Streptomyces shenzhenensis]RMB81133.1 two-component sensor histidine kinase [Streptomyces shenzhenensis]